MRSNLAIDLRLLLLPQLLLHLGQHLLHPLDLWDTGKRDNETCNQHPLDLWDTGKIHDETCNQHPLDL